MAYKIKARKKSGGKPKHGFERLTPQHQTDQRYNIKSTFLYPSRGGRKGDAVWLWLGDRKG